MQIMQHCAERQQPDHDVYILTLSHRNWPVSWLEVFNFDIVTLSGDPSTTTNRCQYVRWKQLGLVSG